MSKRITILGSTGSIGRQSLEVISACGMEAVALTANSSVKLLEEQARRYRPELAVLMDERAAGDPVSYTHLWERVPVLRPKI